MYSLTIEDDANDFVKAIFNEIRGEDPDYRPLLILVNPNSGSGAAKRRYEAEVAPFFKKINLVTEVLVTKRAGHAEEIGRTIDASKYRGVVTASGDGLLYEVLQGILSRKDDAIATIRKLKLGVRGVRARSARILIISLKYYEHCLYYSPISLN